MPEISRFLGIVIFIYYRDHGVPHFHARYGEDVAAFSIEDLKLIAGQMPKRPLALIIEWAFEHRLELMENWHLAEAGKPLKKITPLD